MQYLSAGEGRPVLFLHGGGARANTYKETLELLAKQYFIIAPDIPCFGKSDVPSRPWNFLDYAKYFDQFIKALKLEEPILIGHSFGGGIALNLAVINRHVSRLILINSAGIPPQSSFKKILILVAKTIIENYFSSNKELGIIELGKCIAYILKNPLKLPVILKTVKKSVYEETKNLENVRARTLILWSEKDEIFPANYAKIFHKKIPNSKLTITSGTHAWSLFYPQEFYNIVHNFLKSNKLPRA